jgi:hypothetical protein
LEKERGIEKRKRGIVKRLMDNNKGNKKERKNRKRKKTDKGKT